MRLFKFLTSAAVALFVALPAFAQSTATPVLPSYGTTIGCPPAITYCSFPVGTTPIAGTSQYGLTLTSVTTLTVPATANGAFVTVESAAGVSFTFDGTTPTASKGHLVAAGTTIWFSRPYLALLQFIQQSAGAKIDVSYVQ